MELLKKKIVEEGRVLPGDILKVDNFLNHQVDVRFMEAVGAEFARRFEGVEVNKILTIETSGIAVASIVSKYFGYCPVVFAKKMDSLNLDKEIYCSEAFSFTKNRNYRIMVSKRYLSADDKVLIIDDFLANGKAVLALKDVVEQSGAELEGVGIVIEKGFMPGGQELRKSGVQVESLAVVKAMDDEGNIEFE